MNDDDYTTDDSPCEFISGFMFGAIAGFALGIVLTAIIFAVYVVI